MKGNTYNWKLPDIEALKELYWVKHMSISAIANNFGVTHGAVRNKLHRHDIALRSMSEAQNLIANHISVTQDMVDFLDGLLLGDGCIFPNRYYTSAQYRHTDKRREYIVWLGEQLASLGITVGNITNYGAFRINSKFYREFIAIRERWYPEGAKRVPSDIQLKPITLLNWYIGDGNYRKPDQDGSGERLSIAMQYDEQGKALLCEKLHELGIANTSHRDSIYIRHVGHQRFFNLITEDNIAIPECYDYKFPRRYYHGTK